MAKTTARFHMDNGLVVSLFDVNRDDIATAFVKAVMEEGVIVAPTAVIVSSKVVALMFEEYDG